MTLRQILRPLSLCCQAKGKKAPAKRKLGASRPLWNVWSHTACQFIPSHPCAHTKAAKHTLNPPTHMQKHNIILSQPRAEALRKKCLLPPSLLFLACLLSTHRMVHFFFFFSPSFLPWSLVGLSSEKLEKAVSAVIGSLRARNQRPSLR